MRQPAAPAILSEKPLRACWFLDFVHDLLVCGHFRILNAAMTQPANALLAIADTSLSGKRVVRKSPDKEASTILTCPRLVQGRRPLALHRAGQAEARASTAVCVTSCLRDGFLAYHTARLKLAARVDDFNTARPHSAIGYLTPAA